MLGKTKFSDSSDSLVLEDESARVQLRGSALRVGELVTGLIVAVRGTAVAGGDFWVTVRSLFLCSSGVIALIFASTGNQTCMGHVLIQ